ncbi:MAG: MFS transporter [Burkholderiales bacterium]|nr:MFS transporter [Burkholderiales bacterium]
MWKALDGKGKATYLALLIIAAVYFCSVSFMFFLPHYVLAKGGNEQQAGWLLGVALLPVVLLSTTSGQLSTRVSPRRLIIGGLLTYSISTLAMQLCDGVSYVLYLLRGLQITGHVFVFTPLFAYAAQMVPDKNKAQSIGYFSFSVQVGNTIGTILASNLISHFGYDRFFVYAGVITLLAIIATIPLKALQSSGAPNASAQSCSQQNFVISNTVRGNLIMIAALGTVFGAILQFGPVYLEYLWHSQIVEQKIPVPYLLSTMLITIAIARLFLGKFVDGKYKQFIVVISHFILMVTILLFTLAVTKYAVAATAIVFGMSYGLLYPAVNAAVLSNTPPTQRGKMSGRLTMLYELGYRGTPIILGSAIYHYGYINFFYILLSLYVISFLLCYYLARIDLTQLSLVKNS